MNQGQLAATTEEFFNDICQEPTSHWICLLDPIQTSCNRPVLRRRRHKIRMPVRSKHVQIVLTISPRPRPRRLASRSPSVVPAVRAATIVSQYQGLVILPYWLDTNHVTNRTTRRTSEP